MRINVSVRMNDKQYSVGICDRYVATGCEQYQQSRLCLGTRLLA